MRPLSRAELSFALLYTVAATAMLLLVPGGHPLLLVPALAALATYLLQRVVRLPLEDGYVSIVQPAFVVLLFSVPLNWIAILVPLGLFSSTIVDGRRISPRRLAFALADAWYCIPPILILSWLAPGAFDWSHWPVYLAALTAELIAGCLGPLLRLAIRGDELRVPLGVLGPPVAVDVLLTPFGAAAAHAGQHAFEQSVLVLASVLILVALLSRERTARMSYEARALRDGLTGLANRELFDELLEATSRRLGRSGEMSALLFIDLDNFKQVNDVHGHPAGDVVLQTTAARIEQVVRDADTVARFGGDEFAVLLADPSDRTAAERVASAIRRAVAQPICIDAETTVQVDASIGIAVLGTATEPALAVARADEEMYEAKQVAHERVSYR